MRFSTRIARYLGGASAIGVLLGVTANIALDLGWVQHWPLAPEPRHMTLYMNGEPSYLIAQDPIVQQVIWTFTAFWIVIGTACVFAFRTSPATEVACP
jgi:hypothetical protein